MESKYEKFGKYVLLERIASGGMAEVHLAKAIGSGGLSKFFALKRILPQYSETPEFIDMFKDEARITVNLQHNNIVSLYEFGIEKSQFYLAMEYIEGKNLRQILNRLKTNKKQFNLEQSLFIIKEAASGLDCAHRCLDDSTGRPLNIIHRDISPQNIMLSFEGEIKIIDFGIAKAESKIENTRAGTLKGKFGYMSPEQAEGLEVDLRTDIFSLGILLWELLANDRLFVANNEINTLRKIRDCQIPSLRKINPNIPQELDNIVMKALTQDRNVRYQTTFAFHKDLNHFLNKHYPDFTSHDFSIFIKTLFAEEMLANRKKNIKFLKIPVKQEFTSSYNENTEITQTITSTKGSAYFTEKSKTQNITNTQEKNPLNFKEIKLDRKKIIKQSLDIKKVNEESFVKNLDIIPVTQATSTNTPFNTASVSNYTSVSQHSYRKNSSNTTFKVAAFLLLILGLTYLIKPKLVTKYVTNYITKLTHVTNSTDAASNIEITDAEKKILARKKTLSFMVLSSPPDAKIYLNDKYTKMTTPGVINIPKNKSFNISLKLNGYKPFSRRYGKTTTEGKQIKISLEESIIGFLNINVIPNSANIYINGEKIAKKAPIKNYEIPAGKRIIVKAINPFTQVTQERLIIVDRNQLKQINLNLSKSNKKRRPSNRKKANRRR